MYLHNDKKIWLMTEHFGCLYFPRVSCLQTFSTHVTSIWCSCVEFISRNLHVFFSGLFVWFSLTVCIYTQYLNFLPFSFSYSVKSSCHVFVFSFTGSFLLIVEIFILVRVLDFVPLSSHWCNGVWQWKQADSKHFWMSTMNGKNDKFNKVFISPLLEVILFQFPLLPYLRLRH